MREIDAFKPFDVQTISPTTWHETMEIKRAINMLVAEVRELRKKLES